MQNRQKTDATRVACLMAGVRADEMQEQPELGLILSGSGLRKLAAVAPDRENAAGLVVWAQRVERGR